MQRVKGNCKVADACRMRGQTTNNIDTHIARGMKTSTQELKTNKILKQLLCSNELSIRFRVLKLIGKATAAELANAQTEIKLSPRAKRLLSECNANGEIPFHPYAKWYGAHWVLVCLADLHYPAADLTLLPLRKQVYGWLFSKEHQKSIRSIAGLTRRHASQEGNALFALLTLGLADERTEILAERLCEWQWPDGGWNCDTRPATAVSSFTESLIPLRALALHGQLTRNRQSQTAAKRAAEFFLKRRLFKRQRDGSIISPDFVKLHFPCYWHYDFLFGLKVMVESGFIQDERCRDGLEFNGSHKDERVRNDRRSLGVEERWPHRRQRLNSLNVL